MFGLALTVGLSSCVGPIERVEARAPFDLDCPSSQVKYIELDDNVVGARGCGKRATYVVPCKGLGNCESARMNSASDVKGDDGGEDDDRDQEEYERQRNERRKYNQDEG